MHSDIKVQIELRFNVKIARVLYTATILRKGWEMDNEAWAVTLSDGSIEAFTTSHGGACRLPVDELLAHIKETQASVQELQLVLAAVRPDPDHRHRGGERGRDSHHVV